MIATNISIISLLVLLILVIVFGKTKFSKVWKSAVTLITVFTTLISGFIAIGSEKSIWGIFPIAIGGYMLLYFIATFLIPWMKSQ